MAAPDAAPTHEHHSDKGAPPPDAPPPNYDAVAGSSSASGPSSTANSAAAAAAAAAAATPQGGDDRALPEGWVKQWDASHNHFFWVDTKASPPRSIWTHPLDDPVFLSAHPQFRSGPQFAPPSSAPPSSTSHTNESSARERIKAAGDRAAERARNKPEPHGLKKVSRQMKDKSTGMDHVARAREKAERQETHKIAEEQKLATARAFVTAAQFGQPQYLGKDERAGTEYWAEPPAAGFPPGLYNSFPPPYGFESRRDGNRVYVRPARPPYGYGPGYSPMGGGMGIGMPVLGGLAGGMLLGGLMF